MPDMDRRTFLRGIGLAAGSALAAPHIVGIARAGGVSFRQQLRHKIEHIVVIFQENRSFDH
ncbi:secreted protein containing Phosphoesterase domain protein, partial [mine drainage metagenome]